MVSCLAQTKRLAREDQRDARASLIARNGRYKDRSFQYHVLICSYHQQSMMDIFVYCTKLFEYVNPPMCTLTITYEPGTQVRQWDLANCRTVQFVLCG